jgi:hypothetical protein
MRAPPEPQGSGRNRRNRPTAWTPYRLFVSWGPKSTYPLIRYSPSGLLSRNSINRRGFRGTSEVKDRLS